MIMGAPHLLQMRMPLNMCWVWLPGAEPFVLELLPLYFAPTAAARARTRSHRSCSMMRSSGASRCFTSLGSRSVARRLPVVGSRLHLFLRHDSCPTYAALLRMSRTVDATQPLRRWRVLD